MSYTLSSFLTDVNIRVNNESGTVTPAIITNFVNESLRRVRRKFDLPSAEVITQYALYSGVYQYALPYEGFKDYLVLRGNYQPYDQVFMRNVSEDVFWSNLQSGNIKSEKRNGLTRGLLFNLLNPSTGSSVINACLGPTTDGTWVASGDASGLTTNNLFSRSGSSSLSFNITPSTGTATLTNSTMSPKDLSGVAFVNSAMLTPWLYFPSATGYTGFTLKFGSSALNYNQISTTTQIDSSAFTTGWNQLGFDWLTSTTVGTPTNSAITYVQLNITFPLTLGTQTGVLLNDLTARQRRIFNLHSTTDYLVIDSGTNLPKETFTSSSDTSSYFNIDRSFIDFFLYETLEQINTVLISDPDTRAYYQSKRQELEMDLIMRYPSKRQPEVQTYADQTMHDYWMRRGNGRW